MSKELLENAAKAMGFEVVGYDDELDYLLIDSGIEDCPSPWNPLTIDADCARMEAELGIDVEWFKSYVLARIKEDFIDVTLHSAIAPYCNYNNDRQAARRMASTRVAAAIGERME